jgi:hypothetical protein
VAAVAEGAVLGMLATAPSDGLGYGQVHLQRGEGRALVRAIAKRLAVRLATTAPVITAGGGGLNVRSPGGNLGFTHGSNL